MNQAILFSFHNNPEICIDRIKMLKNFNGKIPIYGLYGGPEKDFIKIAEQLNPYLDSIYCIKHKSKDWKWMNPDLAMRDWFKSVGNVYSFDRLYLVEWDLLFFDSLAKIYNHVPKNGVCLTALNPLKNVEHDWSWTTEEPYKSQWKKLLDIAKEKFNYNKESYASLGPGYCFPRKFLEKYSKTEVPELCHDELRVPLFSQILGYELFDTRFYKKWSDKAEQKFFNCHGNEIDLEIIKAELAKKDGRRVFHPYRQKLDF